MSESASPSGVPGSVQRIPCRLTTVTLAFWVGVAAHVSVVPSTLNSAGNIVSPSGLSCAVSAVKS